MFTVPCKHALTLTLASHDTASSDALVMHEGCWQLYFISCLRIVQHTDDQFINNLEANKTADVVIAISVCICYKRRLIAAGMTS
jgi:hypothetical protein